MLSECPHTVLLCRWDLWTWRIQLEFDFFFGCINSLQIRGRWTTFSYNLGGKLQELHWGPKCWETSQMSVTIYCVGLFWLQNWMKIKPLYFGTISHIQKRYNYSISYLCSLFTCTYRFIFSEPSESTLQAWCLFTPWCFSCGFPKNGNILLQNHNTVIKFRKFNTDFNLQIIFRCCQLFSYSFSPL